MFLSLVCGAGNYPSQIEAIFAWVHTQSKYLHVEPVFIYVCVVKQSTVCVLETGSEYRQRIKDRAYRGDKSAKALVRTEVQMQVLCGHERFLGGESRHARVCEALLPKH